MIGIYKFTNKINNKRYIGKSIDIEKRRKTHERNSVNCDGYFYNAIRKYGLDNFDFSIIEECSKEELNEKEKYWIKYYNSNNSEYGYNITSGGDGLNDVEAWNKGISWNEETKKKLSESQKKRFENPEEHEKLSKSHKGQTSSRKGKHLSDETKEKLRQANLGKKQSQETINKRVEKLKGHNTSEETKKKISEAQKGKIIPEEQRIKISNTLKGHIPWNKGLPREMQSRFGKHHSLETIEKIRQSNILTKRKKKDE